MASIELVSDSGGIETSHTLFSFAPRYAEFPMTQKAIKKWLFLALVEKRHLTKAACVIATSEHEKHSISQKIHNRIEVNALGVSSPPSTHELQRQKLIFLSRHSGLVDKAVIVFFGRVHPKKGVGRVIEMFAQLKNKHSDLRLLVIGESDPIYLRALQTKLKEEDVVDQVVFAGYLDDEQKWGALSVGKVFVLPSHQENFGLAVVEAMSLGLPVVISKGVDLWPEIEKANAGIALDLEHGDKWVDVLDNLLDDPSEREVLAENARDLARTAYSWPSSTERLLGIYNACREEPGISAGVHR